MFYTLRNSLWANLYFGFTKFGILQKNCGVLQEQLNMKTIVAIIKSIVALLLTLCGLACFIVGIFCLYGGADGRAFCTEAFVGTAIGVGIAAVMALLTSVLYRFDKRLILTLLILHEMILFSWLAIAIACCKELSQIMLHLILLMGVLTGGY